MDRTVCELFFLLRVFVCDASASFRLRVAVPEVVFLPSLCEFCPRRLRLAVSIELTRIELSTSGKRKQKRCIVKEWHTSREVIFATCIQRGRPPLYYSRVGEVGLPWFVTSARKKEEGVEVCGTGKQASS